MNQPQLVTDIQIKRGLGRASLRRKAPGTDPLLKPKVFLQSPQIQRPTLPSQKLQITSLQRVIQPTYVERKQIMQPLNCRPWK